MKRATIYIYTVTGTGEFPLDMLRHDRAFPTHEADSGAMTRSFLPRSRESHSVTLTSRIPPTEERWASYRWEVSDLRRQEATS